MAAFGGENMILSSMAFGAVAGSIATVILVAIFIVYKKVNRRTLLKRNCQPCETFLKEDADTSNAFVGNDKK